MGRAALPFPGGALHEGRPCRYAKGSPCNAFHYESACPSRFITLLYGMYRHARDVVLHISHDAWVEDEKQDIPMRQLSDKEVH